MSDFQTIPQEIGWPIIHETESSSVSSSSKNVSPKGTKFEEDPRTYSSKVTRIVLPTFGDNDDAKWSDRFLDRELFIKDLYAGNKEGDNGGCDSDGGGGRAAGMCGSGGEKEGVC